MKVSRKDRRLVACQPALGKRQFFPLPISLSLPGSPSGLNEPADAPPRINLGKRQCAAVLLIVLVSLLMAPAAAAQKIAFRKAVELALAHSAGMGIALADQVRARQSYLEARNTFVPQVTFGSGIAKTWGYPMSIEGSAPSLFNITSQSFLFNLAQRNSVRASRVDWDASSTTLQNQRQATLLETAVTYMQLDRAAAKLRTLREQAIDAGRLETISRQRLEEGVDSKADATRSSLIAARLRLRVAEAQGNADLLRQRLGQLTGLEPAELETDSTSLLPPPEIDQRADLAARAVANSPEVKVAMEKARAAQLRAKSEHFATYPSVDLVGNYGLFTEYNNLDLLFPAGKFSRHNATFGISIRMPFVNATQRSRASAADAEALKAQKMAQVTREQVANDTLRLQRTVQQLEAARDVAKLEQELAESNVIAAQTKVESGNGTIKDRENARIEAGDKQAALLDAQFQLDRARLELLRATGDLEAWALP